MQTNGGQSSYFSNKMDGSKQPPIQNSSKFFGQPAQSSASRIEQINARLAARNCLTYDRKIYYLTEYYEIEEAAQELLDWVNDIREEGQVPVGFDMEWPFTYKTGPLKTALIQFSFSTNVCYLFQVWKFKTLPRSLIALVHHKKLLLHGNCIKNDLRKLGRDFPDVGNTDQLVADCCDLGQYANRVLQIKESWSMARLVKEFLKTNIDKDKEVRMSQWNKALTEEQQIYAAIDVYASQLLYQKIRELELQKKTESENNLLLQELQKDFEREDAARKNSDLDDLLQEYEKIQAILNKNSSEQTQEGNH